MTTQQQKNIIYIKEKDDKTQGPLTELFHSKNITKIIEFLIIFQEYDYNKKEISKGSNVSFRHTLNAIKILEETQIIKQTRKIGHAHLYKYNTQNETAKLIHNLYINLACDRATRNAEKQKPDDPIIVIC